MPAFDVDKLRTLSERLYFPVVARAFGDPGVAALRETIEVLRRLYAVLALERLTSEVVVFRALDEAPALGEPLAFTSVEDLAAELRDRAPSQPFGIRVSANGSVDLFRDFNLSPTTLSSNCIVYVGTMVRESFIVKGEETEVFNPGSDTFTSVFEVPTFKVLDEALRYYRSNSVRTSRCRIFRTAWGGAAPSMRIVFCSAPESIMRDSLVQYLQSVLRGAEVRAEQPMDDSHPVDIKITWQMTNRLAVIEIKWIGKSVSSSGGETDYGNSRANAGAVQLAQYLDWNRQEAPDRITTGYLVVFDGRRRGVSATTTTVSCDDGLHFRDVEIPFSPEFHRSRSDFAEPIRMFAEPICR